MDRKLKKFSGHVKTKGQIIISLWIPFPQWITCISKLPKSRMKFLSETLEIDVPYRGCSCIPWDSHAVHGTQFSQSLISDMLFPSLCQLEDEDSSPKMSFITRK